MNTKFSDFIRNGTPEEKERVMLKVARGAIKDQNKIMNKHHLFFLIFYFITPTTLCVTALSQQIGFILAYILVVPVFGEITWRLKKK